MNRYPLLHLTYLGTLESSLNTFGGFAFQHTDLGGDIYMLLCSSENREGGFETVYLL